eukprot:308349-Pyramimonas_sp.AAC.1
MVRQRVAFIGAQSAAGLSRDGLLASQTQSLCATFATTVGISITVATDVSAEIAGGPWSDEQKQRLATSLSAAAAASAQ